MSLEDTMPRRLSCPALLKTGSTEPGWRWRGCSHLWISLQRHRPCREAAHGLSPQVQGQERPAHTNPAHNFRGDSQAPRREPGQDAGEQASLAFPKPAEHPWPQPRILELTSSSVTEQLGQGTASLTTRPRSHYKLQHTRHLSSRPGDGGETRPRPWTWSPQDEGTVTPNTPHLEWLGF